MNRTIKFRAWDKRIEKLYSWDEMSNDYIGVGSLDKLTAFTNTEEICLMQFTGLLDKNGKEIYEGDIIQVLDRDWTDYEKDTQKLVVYYSRDSYVLISLQGIEEIKKDSPDIYNPLWVEKALYKAYGRDRFEIIGNIYSNPELLK